MPFKKAIKLITGEKQHPGRALDWMERFIAAAPANDKKFLEEWISKRGNLDRMVADFYRDFFADWKKEERSRSAKGSRSKRNPRFKGKTLKSSKTGIEAFGKALRN